MAIIQVARLGDKFAVLEDSTVVSHHDTRGQAIKAAIQYKEQN